MAESGVLGKSLAGELELAAVLADPVASFAFQNDGFKGPDAFQADVSPAAPGGDSSNPIIGGGYYG